MELSMELSYGEKIKQYRASKKLTQVAFSKKIGISTSMLGMIEQGFRKPNEKTQKKILDLTGISYYDEVIKQISKEVSQIIINYIISNSKFFIPETLPKVNHVFRTILNKKIPIQEFINKEKNDEFEYIAINLINLLKDFAQNNNYNIKEIFGSYTSFIESCIPLIINILRKSPSIIYKIKAIPLYDDKLPLYLKRNTVHELLSEDYFSDKSKFAYVIQDDDMLPKYKKGYTVIAVECDEKNTSGDVILSINNNSPVLRKISFKDSLVIVEAYNPKIKTEIFTKDEIRILGQIIEVRFFN